MARDDINSGFHTVGRIGAKRHRTREGYLLCEDVPVARTGYMQYHPSELRDSDGNTPFAADGVGVVNIFRDEREVFKPESLASLQGKPLTMGHPSEDVTPENWNSLAGGTVFNPRRGQGPQSDLLLADILVTNKQMIDAIEGGTVEVSCGYDPEYMPLLDGEGRPRPGFGEQRNILYNHLALVDQGRCGSRCAIGDQLPSPQLSKEITSMTTRSKRRGLLGRALDRAIDALSSKDEKAMRQALDELNEIKEDTEAEDELPPTGESVHMPSGDSMPMWAVQLRDAVGGLTTSLKALDRKVVALDESFAEWAEEEKKEPEHKEGEAEDGVGTGNEKNEKILGQLELEAPPGTGDAIRRATDSALLADSFRDTVAKAEVLAPGLTLPSFDARTAPAKTFETICGLRRTALDLAYGAPQTRGMIDSVTGGRGIDTKKATCDSVRSVFNAVAAMRSVDNNRGTAARDLVAVGGGTPVARGQIKSVADLNRAADAKYRKSA